MKARVAEAEEDITTTLADGTEETVNTAQPGDVVVTNPGGETYVIGSDKFAGGYEATDEDGVFQAKGMVRAFQNDTGKAVTIVPSWGGTQEVDLTVSLQYTTLATQVKLEMTGISSVMKSF